jgi:NAD(P)-dependent dehydrogenase (short-subunit alcohol dehydrogenase family)
MDTAHDLAGRRVVITGAGRGLGRALAIVAADRGGDVVLLARDAGALRQTAEAIAGRSGRAVLSAVCDLADPASIRDAADMVAQTGAVDVLVNNGAPWLPGALEDLAEEEIARTVAAAVTGTILLTKALLPALKQSKAADIVTIVSTAGLLNGGGEGPSAAFHAAKHGQSGFSDRLRRELKPHGIRVSAIYPPDFDDLDPLAADWDRPRDPAASEALTNREVVAAVLFAITAPRTCAFPMIVLDNMRH